MSDEDAIAPSQQDDVPMEDEQFVCFPDDDAVAPPHNADGGQGIADLDDLMAVLTQPVTNVIPQLLPGMLGSLHYTVPVATPGGAGGNDEGSPPPLVTPLHAYFEQATAIAAGQFAAAQLAAEHVGVPQNEDNVGSAAAAHLEHVAEQILEHLVAEQTGAPQN